MLKVTRTLLASIASAASTIGSTSLITSRPSYGTVLFIFASYIEGIEILYTPGAKSMLVSNKTALGELYGVLVPIIGVPPSIIKVISSFINNILSQNSAMKNSLEPLYCVKLQTAVGSLPTESIIPSESIGGIFIPASSNSVTHIPGLASSNSEG